MKLSQDVRGLLNLRPLQLFALSFLLAGLAGLNIASRAPVRDADVWWHLKVGDWILQNHAVPHTGIFSYTAATKPWVAYSWGHEVLLSKAYAWFGLIGIASFGIALTAAVAWAFFWMLYRLSGKFWLSWILCAAGSVSFLFNLLPRPAFFSMILIMPVLSFILQAQHGRTKLLYWLPAIFVLWANLHIQFVYGLFVLGLFVGVVLFYHACDALGFAAKLRPERLLAPGLLLGVLAACFVAVCVGPYTYHLFEVALNYSTSHVPYAIIQELQPPDFKTPSDYFLVLVGLGGFVAIFRKRKADLFKIALLSIATVLAFRTLRDAWFLAVCAAAFIADSYSQEPDRSYSLKLHEWAAVGAMLAIMLFLLARNMGFNTRDLDRTISSDYPVDAANYLRRNPLPGPLYNHLGWGGFLIWYMPNYPVAIDGRNDLYGDEMDLVTFNSVGGDYASDPYLKESRLVLLPREAPLAAMLNNNPEFRLVYQDRLAVVFARN